MAIIQFDNGVRVNFDGNPTKADIEEVAKRVVTMAPTEQKQKEVPFDNPIGDFAAGVVKPFAQGAVTAFNLARGVSALGRAGLQKAFGDDKAAQETLKRYNASTKTKVMRDIGNLGVFAEDEQGNVRPDLGWRANTEKLTRSLGADLQIAASVIPGGGSGVNQIVAQGGKQLVKRAAVQGLKEGLFTGTAFGLGSGAQDADLSEGNIGASVGNILKQGAIGGIVGGGLGAGSAAISARIATHAGKGIARTEDLESKIQDNYNRAVKPSVAGTKNARMVEVQKGRTNDAIKTIVKNKGQLKFVNDNGEEVIGQLPRSMNEFSRAIEQVKGNIYKQYDDLARQAGDDGAKVSLSKIAMSLDDVIKDPALNATPRGQAAIKYAKELQTTLWKQGKVDTSTGQEIIKNLNESLKAYYRSGTGGESAIIDAGVANNIRKELDKVISSTAGSGYQQLKSQYGSLSSIEKDVTKRAFNLAKKDTKGLIDFTDIFSGSDIVHGITALDPSLIAGGVAKRGIKEWIKRINDPNRLIKGMFESADRLSILEKPGAKAIQAAAVPKVIPKKKVSSVDLSEFPTEGFDELSEPAKRVILALEKSSMTAKASGDIGQIFTPDELLKLPKVPENVAREVGKYLQLHFFK